LWIHRLNILLTAFTARKCDALGHFLPDDAPPPPRSPKLPDDWSLYCNRLEFELANFLFTHTEMPVKKIDALLEIWAASMLELGGEPLFSNHTDLYRIIDSTSVGDVKWENFTVRYNSEDQGNNAAPWMSDTYDVWYRDPRQVVHNILASPQFRNEMDYTPYREYDTANDERRWQNFMSGDWAWEDAVFACLLLQVSTNFKYLGPDHSR